jgi:hypothetical protein
MRHLTRLLAVFVVLAASRLPASAQSRSTIGIGGGVDFAHMTQDESFLGSGVGVSGGVQWRLTPATAVEFEVNRAHHVRDLDLHAVVFGPGGRIDVVPYTERWEGNATFAIGSVAHAFGTGTLRPVAWGGGGAMFHDGTRHGPVTPPAVPPGFTMQPGDAASSKQPSTTSFVLDSGAGVDARLGSRAGIRPFVGFRLTGVGGAGPKYIIRGGVRVSFDL